jgi:hypothetical protein
MTDQPEALRLANELGGVSDALADEAAAELRRLVAKNERLHQINQSHEMKLSVRGYEIQIEDLRLAHAELRERNAELLAALKARLPGADAMGWNTDIARAAISKAEGGQT